MKNCKKNIALLLFIFCLTLPSFSQSNSAQSEIIKTKISSDAINILNYITISRWKYDAQSCLNISFDDNCASHNKISKIFDQYGYKATFFVNAFSMFSDSLIDMSRRGHEIGNHTLTHSINLSKSDSVSIDFEISNGKEGIENLLGIPCLSFVEPFNGYNSLSQKIAFKYCLFDRDYSEYAINDRFDLNAASTMNQIAKYISNGINNRNLMIIDGHGIDGDGYDPISKNFLVQMLDTIKRNVDSGDLWITTLKQAQLYDNLYREISLEKKQRGDTITILFKNFDQEKYKDVDSALISISIPTAYYDNLVCLTTNVDVNKRSRETVLSFDLQRDTCFTFIAKSPNYITDTTTYPVSLFTFPNPTSDFLNLNVDGELQKTEIYDLQGKLLFSQISNNSRINVSELKAGCYLLKVLVDNNYYISLYRAKFIKK